MRVLSAFLLSFAVSAMAYQVITPNSNTGWTNSGPQNVTWQRVSTDAANFTAVLTNVNRDLWPSDQVLAALVDGSLLSTTVNPPSGGWPIGDGFRVNFVKNDSDLNTIFAQSGEFSIKPNSSSTLSTSSPLFITRTTDTSTATAIVPDASSTWAAEPTGNSNDALSGKDPRMILLGLLGFLGLLLA